MNVSDNFELEFQFIAVFVLQKWFERKEGKGEAETQMGTFFFLH